jgi:hypothetical protein
MSISDSWTTAIFSSTSCLRRQAKDPAAVDPCLKYLYHLEAQLRLSNPDETDSDQWSIPPQHKAPDWITFQYEIQNDVPSQLINTNSSTRRTQTDFIVRAPNTGHNLDCRRILIRILESQSVCLALNASALRRPNQWKEGANQYQMSLEKIHEALDVADTQISKWMTIESNGGAGSQMHSSKQDLIEDADTVSIAIESLAKGREKFIQLGRKEKASLLRELEPQWEARDEVKRRIGEARWNSNSHAKNDHAKLRKDKEMEYRDVCDALQVIEAMDLVSATEKNKELISQLDNNADAQQQQQRQRYNGLRPDDSLLENRVSWSDYPDPTAFEWAFTGSSRYTEFFEKDNVKLDWYFTTATMKTSLDHPTQGRTQMFRKNVDPSLYRKILEDPRTHTNQGYQRT